MNSRRVKSIEEQEKNGEAHWNWKERLEIVQKEDLKRKLTNRQKRQNNHTTAPDVATADV